MSTAVDEPALARPRRSRTILAVVFLVVAAASVVVAVLFAEHGVRVDTFPPYVAGDKQTEIRQFSGPWITGAFGLVALAGLLVVAAAADLRRPMPEPAPSAPDDAADSAPDITADGPDDRPAALAS